MIIDASVNSTRPLRVLAITNLFPNAVRPHAAAFNRQQLGALSRQCDLRILATIPWFPGSRFFSDTLMGQLHSLPKFEQIDDLTVEHPRTLYLPLVGRGFSGMTHAYSLRRVVKSYADQTDIIFGAWVYPDGVASIMLAKKYGLPVVVKCFGSDINTLVDYPGPAKRIRQYLPQVDGFVAVSNPLKEKVAGLGVAEDKIDVVIDGVNRELFYPRDQQTCRQAIGVGADGPLIVYVGRAVLTKGLDELLDAYELLLSRVPGVRLAFVGSGGAEDYLRDKANQIGGDIIFAGGKRLEQVARWMSAADVVTLPSYAEGLPNTILEALASGRPVVATDVGGIPDILTAECGALVPARDVSALAQGLEDVLNRSFDPAKISDSIPQRDWDTSAAHLLQVLQKATARHAASAQNA